MFPHPARPLSCRCFAAPALALAHALALALALTSPGTGRAAGPPPRARWIAVVAPAFRDALAPLVAQRRSQGMDVVVLAPGDVLGPAEPARGDAGRLRDHVRGLIRAHPGPCYLLLAGAVGDVGRGDTVVPALRGTQGRMLREPSDNAYGCPLGGLLPTAAVGRFPARTPAEARAMVAKTLALENEAPPGPWRRGLTVLAGIPAYNPVVDRVVESIAFARFDRVDPRWTGRAVYTSPSSRFGLPDRDIRPRSLRYVEEGAAFVLYLGHSSARGLWAGDAPFLDRADWGTLKIARGPGVFITFGCNGCQLGGFDGEGYGVAAARNPTGPAAVVGSHGICYAALAQLAADGLFRRTLAGEPPDRLGEAWLALLEGVARGGIDPISYRLLDAVDGDPRTPQAAQRLEHLEMFVLLGDPALRLPRLADGIALDCGPARPGQRLVVRGVAPPGLEGARVRLTLERPVTAEPVGLEPVPAAPGPGRDGVRRANHDRANQFVLAAAETRVRGGAFLGILEVPARLPRAALRVRAHAATDGAEAQGVTRITTETGDGS